MQSVSISCISSVQKSSEGPDRCMMLDFCITSFNLESWLSSSTKSVRNSSLTLEIKVSSQTLSSGLMLFAGLRFHSSLQTNAFDGDIERKISPKLVVVLECPSYWFCFVTLLLLDTSSVLRLCLIFFPDLITESLRLFDEWFNDWFAHIEESGLRDEIAVFDSFSGEEYAFIFPTKLEWTIWVVSMLLIIQMYSDVYLVVIK